MNSNELLDIAKKHFKVDSDNKLAQAWGISRVFISNIRNNRKSVPIKKAEQVAEWGNLDKKEVKISITRERNERRIMYRLTALHQGNKDPWDWFSRYFTNRSRMTFERWPAGTAA